MKLAFEYLFDLQLHSLYCRLQCTRHLLGHRVFTSQQTKSFLFVSRHIILQHHHQHDRLILASSIEPSHVKINSIASSHSTPHNYQKIKVRRTPIDYHHERC